MKKNLLLALFVSIIWNGYAQTGNVGVGNATPAAKLDVAGDLALREGTAIAVAGANPAVAVTLTTANPENSFYRITGAPTGTMTLNSIANGVDGQIITLVNATTIKLKISNNNVANGILTSGGATTVIAPNGSFTLQYSSLAGRWYVTNAAGATIADWIKATTTDEPAISSDAQYVTGNVGIGNFSGATTTPLGVLHTKRGTNGADFVAAQTTATDIVVSGLANGAPARVLLGTNNSTGGTTTGNQLEFWSNSFGGGMGKLGQISTESTQGTSAGQINGNLIFSTSNNNVAGIVTEKMRIIPNGNVGIGTTTPLTKLHIQANNDNDAAISFSSNGGGTPTQTRIRTIDNNWSGDMLFETSVPGSGAGVVTERMRLKNTGDIQMTGSQGKLWLETNGWNDPGTTGAGIAVDNNSFKSLMIVGNNIAGNLGQNRQVQVWDYMRVNGYLTVGTQANATGTNPPSGTLRYNTTRNCMEYWDGTYWICMGPPTVQRVTVRDQNDENYQGTGCNGCSGWGGSYGSIYNFTVNNLYAGQKIMFYAEVMFDNDTKKNGGFLNATKIYGNGYWGEVEVTVPGGWETVQTKVFPAQTITSTGNLTFSFESNTGITDVRITAVAY